MRFVVHVLAALGLLLAAAAPSYAACGDNPGDAAAVAATRAQIAQQCPCSSFNSHGAYVKCASGVPGRQRRHALRGMRRGGRELRG